MMQGSGGHARTLFLRFCGAGPVVENLQTHDFRESTPPPATCGRRMTPAHPVI
jgi:hypothetical protein